MKFDKIILVIMILLGCFIILNCSSKTQYDENIPLDFSFMIQGWCYFDSETGRYIGKDTVIFIDLSKDDMLYIYNAFKISDFLNLPESFECDKYGTHVFPDLEKTTILFTYKGITKAVTNPSNCSRKTEQKQYRRFKMIDETLFEIINKKDQIKNIVPDTSININNIYM